MKTVILYSTSHGKTRKVVELARSQLAMEVDVHNVRSLREVAFLDGYDVILLFSPTYGDEELQEDMERFVRNLHLDLDGKQFAICELGSYYGYDNFAFGAMRILRRELMSRNARELCEPLSLDSYPILDVRTAVTWLDYLREKINEN